MTNRRQFIRTGAALTAGSFIGGKGFAEMFNAPTHKLGVQLFTFFNEIDNDVEGTLKKVAAVGYTEIESAFGKKGGFYGETAKGFDALLKRNGLHWRSHHVMGAPFKMPPGAKLPDGPDGKPMVIPKMKNLRDDMQELVDGVAEGGAKYIVCANIPVGNKQEVEEAIEILNKTAVAAKKANLTLCYHNHEEEFKEHEGVVAYTAFLNHLDKSVKMELDVAWATKAGQDPAKLFMENPGRFPLWHVKDLDKDGNIVPVGSGTIDYKSIFKHSAHAGLEYAFIEHDFPKDALASITASYKFLRGAGI